VAVLLNAWEILRDSASFILLGFLLAGFLEVVFSRLRLTRLLRGNGRRSVFWATLIGIPLPLCSCSVLPSALTLRKKGAGKGATLSFLISTPETGITSILLTYGLIGPFMAVLRPLAACVTGLIAGLSQNAVERRFAQDAAPAPAAPSDGEPPGCCDNCRGEPAALEPAESDGSDDIAPASSTGRRLRSALRYTFGELFGDIFGWVMVGILAAAAIQTWVAPDVLSMIIGGPWQSMLLMLLVGVPLFVCAEASTPIAAALMAAGLSPGAALVFLLVGPATNIGSIGVLARQLGRRAVVIYLASIVGVALAAGALANASLGGSAGALTAGALEQPFMPGWLKTAGAVAFLALGIITVFRLRYAPRIATWCHTRLSRPVWACVTGTARSVCAACANPLTSGRPAEAETIGAVGTAVVSDGGTEKWTSPTCIKCSSLP
jgi:uncharacterized membrane protein YraQ (UPF0718 family)